MSNQEQQAFDERSLTKEAFESVEVPRLNTIAELLSSHPDVPEDVDLGELQGALSTLANELRSSVTNKVPEIVKLQTAIEKKDKQIVQLQNANQQLFLRIGTQPDPAKQPDNEEKPKLSWADIARKLNDM